MTTRTQFSKNSCKESYLNSSIASLVDYDCGFEVSHHKTLVNLLKMSEIPKLCPLKN